MEQQQQQIAPARRKEQSLFSLHPGSFFFCNDVQKASPQLHLLMGPLAPSLPPAAPTWEAQSLRKDRGTFLPLRQHVLQAQVAGLPLPQTAQSTPSPASYAFAELLLHWRLAHATKNSDDHGNNWKRHLAQLAGAGAMLVCDFLPASYGVCAFNMDVTIFFS